MRNPLQAMLESQFSKVSENLNKAIQELEAMELEGSSGGGAVRITMTGGGQVLGVHIAPAAVSENDLELLQDLVAAAMRDVLAKVARARKEKLTAATPLGALGLEVPDVF